MMASTQFREQVLELAASRAAFAASRSHGYRGRRRAIPSTWRLDVVRNLRVLHP